LSQKPLRCYYLPLPYKSKSCLLITFLRSLWWDLCTLFFGREWEVVNEALAFAGEPVEDLAEDDDEFAEDQEYADEDAPEEVDGVEDASPEVGENYDEEEHSPVTPRSNYSDVLQGSVLDPVSNLEASLNMVADDGDEEEDESESEGSGGLRGFGRALLKVAGGALAVAAAMAAFDFAKERGAKSPVLQGKAGVGAQGKAGVGPQGKSGVGPPGGIPPTATLSNRALQREKSGFGSDRDGMPLCTVRERKVSPVKKGRSADVLLARG
jgi:hypothetical protein